MISNQKYQSAMNCLRQFINFIPNLSLIILPAVFIPLLLSSATENIDNGIDNNSEKKCLYLIIIMSLLWSLNPIPLPIISLLPIVLLPLFGLLSTDQACNAYLRANNMLFLGCLVIALALEKSNFHQRIALKVLLLFEQIIIKLKWMLAGFMFTTMFFSMWIVSTATVAMMLPIIDEIFSNIFEENNNNNDDNANGTNNGINNGAEAKQRPIKDRDNNEVSIINLNSNSNEIESNSNQESEMNKDKITKLFYLCIAYAATIGGVSTLTSSGPNLIMKDILENQYNNQDPVDYASYLLYSTPINVLICLIVWFVLSTIYIRDLKIDKKRQQFLRQHIQQKYDKLGPITFHEWAVIAVFILMILLYTFYKPPKIDGWSRLFPEKQQPKLASAAILCVILLFLIPSKLNSWNIDLHKNSLLDWYTMKTKLEWGVIIIRGGGFAVADAVESSGLSNLVGIHLSQLSEILSKPLLIIFIVIVANMTIEVMRTSATASIMIPIAIRLSENLQINPLKLILPLTASCAYAFISPIGTTSNTLIFYHVQNMSIKDMIIPGLIAKTISITMLLLNTWLFGNFYFNLDDPKPEWLLTN